MNLFNLQTDPTTWSEHTVLMKMMKKVSETTQRTLQLQKEETEKQVSERYASFQETLHGFVESEQSAATEKTCNTESKGNILVCHILLHGWKVICRGVLFSKYTQ